MINQCGVLRSCPGSHSAHFGRVTCWMTSPTSARVGWMIGWLARLRWSRKYQPELVYFDRWIGQPLPRPTRSFSRTTTTGAGRWRGGGQLQGGRVGFRNGHGDVESAADIQPQVWQTDTSISNLWSWANMEHDSFKTPEHMSFARGRGFEERQPGCWTIWSKTRGRHHHQKAQRILREIGGWLKVNRGSHLRQQTLDALLARDPLQVMAASSRRQKPSRSRRRISAYYCRLYAIQLGWPSEGRIRDSSITPEVKVVCYMLGVGAAAAFTRTHGSAFAAAGCADRILRLGLIALLMPAAHQCAPCTHEIGSSPGEVKRNMRCGAYSSTSLELCIVHACVGPDSLTGLPRSHVGLIEWFSTYVMPSAYVSRA